MTFITDLIHNTTIQGLLVGFISEILLQFLKNKVHGNSWLTIIGFITNVFNVLNSKLPSGNADDPKTDQSKIERKSKFFNGTE